ncbi:MAG: AMP-binding protein [Lachnospiraceae bacterium]|nr:AMP-binding protein [Lachnospiraceae bacterium]
MSSTLVDLQEYVNSIAERYADRDAYRYLVDGKVVAKTYPEFKDNIFSLATWLNKSGYQRKHIAILGGTSYEWIVSFLAIACSNNVVIPLDKMLPKADIYNLLDMGDVDFVFYSDEFESYFHDYAGDRELLCFTDVRFIDAMKTEAEELPAINPKEMAELLFTSGTTGMSKGVMLSQENIMANINEIYRLDYASNVKGNPVVMSVLPIHHTFELTVDNLGTLNCGATICINDKMENIVSNMQLFKPAVILVVPAIAEVFYKKLKEATSKGKEKRLLKFAKIVSKLLRAFLIDARRKLYKKIIDRLGGNITNIIVGGAALRPEVVEYFNQFGINMYQGYGLTECAPLVAAENPTSSRTGSVGKVVSYMESKIVDGEILVKGPGVMLGYYKDEKATREAIDADGWFHTGDLGHFDEDGFLQITGRSKNLIILDNGKNVYPEELEAKIKPISGVKDVMVYADGNRIAAVVVPTIYSDRELRKSIKAEIALINESLPTYQKITATHFVSWELPKTTTLKTKRKETMERLEEQLNKKKVEYVAPKTEEQKRITDAFAQVLSKEKVGIYDDFFELGGDSLAAFETAALLGIQAQDIYEYSTPEKLEQTLLLNDHENDKEGNVDVNSLIVHNSNLEYETHPKYILLTGATGFLGAHVLWQLLKKKMNVVCLVRNEERLHSTMKEYFPKEFEFMSYKVVVGDIEKEHFGLKREKYEKLVGRVDMVIHTAANVQHAGHYSDFERTNVIGTQNVIDFCKDANAVLHHTSTASVCGAGTVSQTNPDAIFDENCLDIGQNYVQNVYIRSKYKAEERVLMARKEGLKANIYRIGNLTWRMYDGKFQKNAQDNGFIGRCKGLLKVRVYSDELNAYPIDFTAVDECAIAFVMLALHNRVNNIYHLYNPNMYSVENLTKRLLIHCKRVPQKVFDKQVKDKIQDKEVAILSFYSSIATISKNITMRSDFTINMLKDLGFTWSKVDLKYLKYLRKMV